MTRSHWTDWLADAIRTEVALNSAATPAGRLRAASVKIQLLFDAMKPLLDAGEQKAEHDIARRRWTQLRRMLDEASGLNSGIVDDDLLGDDTDTE